MQVSYAARGVLNRLNQKFSNMNFLFAEFYDFERGIDPYFKRRLAQVPMEQRGKDWLSIMWSRDPVTDSIVTRRFQARLEGLSSGTIASDLKFVYSSIVFTYISNSMSYLEKLEKSFFLYIPDGFSTMFDCTPYKDWDAKQEIKLGYRRKSRIYNGYVYTCIQEGTTGPTEPQWTKGTVEDGTVIWQASEPMQMKVQFDQVACSSIQKYNLDTEDTLCKIDIGGRMFFPQLLGDLNDETGDLDPEGSGIYPVILYPRADISTAQVPNYPDYDTYVTPTPEHWKEKEQNGI